MKKFPLFFIIPALFYSCFNPVQDGNEPVYTPDIAWRVKVNYHTSWGNPFESGGYGYYPEESRTFSTVTPYYARLVKIDLNNGDIMWKTDNVPAWGTNQAQKIGDYIYLPLVDQDRIMVYKDDDNKVRLAATVALNNSFVPSLAKCNGPANVHTAAWDKYIFWGNIDRDNWNNIDILHQGLMRFDTSLINFNIPAGDIQLIEPEMLWQINWKAVLSTNIVIKEGIVYFLTRPDQDSGTSYLVALNAETKNEVWKIPSAFGWGERLNSLVLGGDRLYVIDSTPNLYDRITGETIFEKKEYEYTGVGPQLRGISFYNNKLYYTTQMDSQTYLMAPTADPKRIKNIICIDGDTGNLVWGDLVPGGASIGTFPLVNNGKAYVVTDRGLRVYDAETGVLLGVDRTVKNTGYNHNLLYNDMVIYPDYEGGGMEDGEWYAWLTAIRAE